VAPAGRGLRKLRARPVASAGRVGVMSCPVPIVVEKGHTQPGRVGARAAFWAGGNQARKRQRPRPSFDAQRDRHADLTQEGRRLSVISRFLVNWPQGGGSPRCQASEPVTQPDTRGVTTGSHVGHMWSERGAKWLKNARSATLCAVNVHSGTYAGHHTTIGTSGRSSVHSSASRCRAFVTCVTRDPRRFV